MVYLTINYVKQGGVPFFPHTHTRRKKMGAEDKKTHELEGALASFLLLTCFLFPTVMTLSVAEGLFHKPFIVRYGWIGISIGMTAFSGTWLGMLYYKCWRTSRTRLLFRYFTFVLSLFAQSFFFSAIILPVGFVTSSISEDRFKDYVLMYPLTGTLPLIAGTYISFKSVR